MPPASAVFLLGHSGAILMVTMLFMAVTSAGSAELVAVSSLFTYDIYKTYINKNATGAPPCRIECVFPTQFQAVSSLFTYDICKTYINKNATGAPRCRMVVSIQHSFRIVACWEGLKNHTLKYVSCIQRVYTGCVIILSICALAELLNMDCMTRCRCSMRYMPCTGKTIVRMSQYIICAFGCFMGVMAIILLEIGLSLG